MTIAVLLPCHNEGPAIYEVVRSFQKALPGATVYVYDNNSTDNTTEEARRAGAIVRSETRQGKGHVIRRMFADVEADIYVMADGDGTYDAEVAPELVEKLRSENLDMVVGARQSVEGQETYRKGHEFGNWLLTTTVRTIFGHGFRDMLSGYRVFSRRFVKSFPALSTGFQIETEITIHALSLTLPCAEIDTKYFERAEGTASKLSTYKDGILILSFIMLLFKEIRPFIFFTAIALLMAILSFGLGLPVIIEFFETGLVPRLPTAILSASIMMIGVLSFLCGIILDSLSRGRIEQKRLRYIATATSKE
ncbi:MAG: glycosyltransferase [Rhodospirillales bacterium]|nr:glycosyltransferase [Rhodospirillales bacterium]MCB9996675.1 glycosyltransferase [Rhodospirillales bacterium]